MSHIEKHTKMIKSSIFAFEICYFEIISRIQFSMVYSCQVESVFYLFNICLKVVLTDFR